MSKLNRKFKNALLLTTLGASLALTGCSKKGENKVKVYDTTSQEMTTELQPTEEFVSEPMNNKYTSLAEQSYNDYKEFYDSIGISVPQIENMIKIINNDLVGLSEDNLIDTIDMVNQILLSDQLCQSLDNIDLGMSDSFDVPKSPKLSIYVENEKIKSDLESYEITRDQIINSANNGVISEAEKDLLKNSIINMEQAYNQDEGYMNSTIICEGNKYLQNAWKKNLVVLGAKVIGETEIKDNNGEIYPICPNGDETLIIAQYNMLSSSGENIPDSLQIEYTNIKLRQIVTKYEQGMCSLEEELYRGIKEENHIDSRIEKINLLEQKKYALEFYNQNKKENVQEKMLQA